MLLHPHQRLNFFSDYSHSVTCPYCQSNDTHFIKQLNYCYTDKPLQQFQQWPAWHEATLDSPKSSASPKIGSSNESGYLSLTNGESNVMGSKSSSIWGDKSLWNLSNSPNSNSSMQTANGSMCSSDGKDSFWQSTQSSPILSSSQYPNLNSLWGCSPIKNDAHEESLGSIWNIPTASSQMLDGCLEAPLPPPITYNQKNQPQLLRPQDIGGSVWNGNGMANNGNNNSNNMVCPMSSNSNNKVKEPVGSLWAHPTPPNLPLTLQAQNYNLLSTNSKFQSPIKPMGVAPLNGLLNGCNGYPNQQMGAQQLSQGSTSSNMQLFSDEFLSYLNMIN